MVWAQASHWFATAARPLPWRCEPRDPWAVLVSEVMLQQTQVARVEPAYEAWLSRWPAPADLATDSPADAVRAWTGLGYPRRALRLHAAAVAIHRRHDGAVPDDHDQLLALPGVGGYTAAAVLAFAHKRRVAVLDTNVRRVLARHGQGRAFPAAASPSRAEHAAVTASLPEQPRDAAFASEAVMELGAVMCRSRAPLCDQCPVAGSCAWFAAGRPAGPKAPGRQAKFEGSDRQARGRILRLVAEQNTVPITGIAHVWPDDLQRQRAQRSLVADGLLELTDGVLRLPTVG